MQQAVLQQVLEQISVLNSRELLQVQKAVQERLERPSEAQKRRSFYRSLRASGLVKQVKKRPAVDPVQRKLVMVEGPPVSQTIIEERR